MSDMNTGSTNSSMNTSKNTMPMALVGVVALLLVGAVGYALATGMIPGQSKEAALTEPLPSATAAPTVTSTPETESVESTSASPTVNPADPAMIGIPAAGNVQVIKVEAGSFYFKPNEIRVKKGQKVKIELQSVSMMHDFVIDELGVKVPVTQSGKTGTVEFVANKAGTFQFYCSVGQHKQMGQVGILTVE